MSLTPAVPSALAPAAGPPAARALARYPCVIDTIEPSNGHGPTCGSIHCARLFKCLPIKHQELITETYKKLRSEFNDDPHEWTTRFFVKDEIETMQWYARRIIRKFRRENSDARSFRMRRAFNQLDNENVTRRDSNTQTDAPMADIKVKTSSTEVLGPRENWPKWKTNPIERLPNESDEGDKGGKGDEGKAAGVSM